VKTTKLAALTGATLLCTVACAQPSGPAADLGPMTYDASGTMPCSADRPSYDQACGWRVLRKADGGAELWIANIAVSDRAAFRVLRFANGEFTDRDGDPLKVAKDGDRWLISVGREHYRFADALITGG
jgi:hypothetical protein